MNAPGISPHGDKVPTHGRSEQGKAAFSPPQPEDRAGELDAVFTNLQLHSHVETHTIQFKGSME